MTSRRSHMGPAPLDREEKPCSICREVLPLTAFGPDRNRADGRKRQCLACLNSYQKAWAAANPEKVRAGKIKRKYGVTVQEYEALREKAGGRCEICAVDVPDHLDPAPGIDLRAAVAIDHDHTTGRIRGLLCSACNCAIGYMADDPDRLEAAARYLRAHAMTG